jgi:hypothetical protein
MPEAPRAGRSLPPGPAHHHRDSSAPLPRPGFITPDPNKSLLILIFVDSTSALPPNTFDVETLTGTAHASFDMYQRYLDLLRNEGPCRVSFILETVPPSFRVQSSVEPPGEGEFPRTT